MSPEARELALLLSECYQDGWQIRDRAPLADLCQDYPSLSTFLFSWAWQLWHLPWMEEWAEAAAGEDIRLLHNSIAAIVAELEQREGRKMEFAAGYY